MKKQIFIKIMKIIRIIFLALLAAAELCLDVYFVQKLIESKTYVPVAIGMPGVASDTTVYLGCAWAFFVFFLIAVAEIVRAARGKKWVILPMLYMMATALLLSVSLMMFHAYTYEKDGDDIGAGVTLFWCSLLLFASAWGVAKFGCRRGQGKRNTQVAYQPSETGILLSGEWYFDEACREYCELHGVDIDAFYGRIAVADMAEHSGSAALWKDVRETLWSDREYSETDRERFHQISIYACGYVAYLFVWLLRRDAFCKEAAEYLGNLENQDVKWNLDALKDGRGTPGELLYEKMQGRISVTDIAPGPRLAFLRAYCHARGKAGMSKYDSDYADIVLDSMLGGSEVLWCRTFDRARYLRFETVMDRRYELFTGDGMPENLIAWQPSPEYAHMVEQKQPAAEDARVPASTCYYAHAFKQKLHVFVEKENEDDKEAFDAYVAQCLEQIDTMDEIMFGRIYGKILQLWGEMWGRGYTPKTLAKHVSDGEVNIVKPPAGEGQTLAYVLRFEADFEKEHGISITIKNGKVIGIGYRMEALSPWAVSWDAPAEEVMW